tara:strand:+ start:114 stop:737 length:624 start_codon:yes stop_codon:yes gene_type:complete
MFNKRRTTHGNRKVNDTSGAYISWKSMRARCHDDKHDNYGHYGARGIVVCESWLFSFESFLADMGDRPVGRTIDRIDGDKGYYPENCRWATNREQTLNRKNVEAIEFKGEMLTLPEIARKYSIPQTTLYRRYKHGVRGEDLLDRGNRNKLRVGDKHHSSKYTDQQKTEMVKMTNEGMTQSQVAKRFGCSQYVVSAALSSGRYGEKKL